MIAFPDINPIALELGPVKIHWYGLMYLIGFGIAWDARPDSRQGSQARLVGCGS